MKQLFILCLIATCLLGCQKSPYIQRKLDFNFGWKFCLQDSSGARLPEFNDMDWKEVILPHDWAISLPVSIDAPAGARHGYFTGGIGWYRKTFELPSSIQNKEINIDFDGIYMNSDVWINGHHLGHRSYGYVSHGYNLTPYLHFDKSNVIAVRVDNSHQPTDRWYPGAGIYRHVWLRVTDKLYIPGWGIYITTPEISHKEATVKIETQVNNNSEQPSQCILTTEIQTPEGYIVADVETDEQISAQSHHTFSQTLKVDQPELWSVESPVLYQIVSTVRNHNKVTDQKNSTFGIRKVEFIPQKGMFLNGQKIVMKGVNIHHDAGCLGVAVPDRAIERRLEILKQMGCNAIRLSHNPHSVELLEICDRMGILLISEFIDKWEIKFTGYGGNANSFLETWERDIKDWIDRDKNHPSVVLWSVGNETLEQRIKPERGVELLNMMKDWIHQYEPSRKVTCALIPSKLGSLKFGWEFPSRMIHHMDVVSYNYQIHYFDEWHKKWSEMLFIASETQIYTNGDPPPSDTLDFSKNSWFAVQNRPYVVGHFIWAGIDYLGESKGWPDRGCPVGLINTCGFRKPISYFTESIYTEKKMVHITVHDDSLARVLDNINHMHKMWYSPPIASHWNLNKPEGTLLPVYLFTNCESVELFLNSESLGEKGLNSFPDQVIRFQVPFFKGTIKAIGKMAGRKCCTDELRTAGLPHSIQCIADRNQINADAKDIAHIEIQILDKDGNLYPLSRHLIQLQVDGPGKLIGVDNGDVADHFNFKGTEVETREGRCLAVVQSQLAKGKVKLTASSKTLQSGTVSIITK